MPEQQNREYKSSWHDDYLKWVCGFANAQTPCLKGNIFITAGQRPADRERTANHCLKGRTSLFQKVTFINFNAIIY
jgi:hypothetical protein